MWLTRNFERSQEMKDIALSHGAKLAMNKQIESYGEVQKLHLNSKKKSIDMEVILKGEIEPLSVHIKNYSLSELDGVHHLSVSGVTTSRTWINTVASEYLEGKAFEIPTEYAKMLKAVM